MRTKKEILTKIAEIESDVRYNYPTANAMINLPLAMIQLDMEARISVLKWILEGESRE